MWLRMKFVCNKGFFFHIYFLSCRMPKMRIRYTYMSMCVCVCVMRKKILATFFFYIQFCYCFFCCCSLQFVTWNIYSCFFFSWSSLVILSEDQSFVCYIIWITYLEYTKRSHSFLLNDSIFLCLFQLCVRSHFTLYSCVVSFIIHRSK